MFRNRVAVIGAIALLCLAGIVGLDHVAPGAYARVQNLLKDAVSRAGRKTAPEPNLVFLAIDSASVGMENADIEELYGLTNPDAPETRALRMMSQHWPWPREVHALILERLVQAGAKVVLFDLTFPTPTDDDEAFRIALERYQPYVVLGSNFGSAPGPGINFSHASPPESLIPPNTPVDDRVGYTNFWPDDDGVVRDAQYRVTLEQIAGGDPRPDSECFLSLVSRGLIKAGLTERVPAGLSARTIRYTGGPRAGFAPHSLFEIFVPDYWKQNYDSGEFFRGKTVLIGAEGSWQHDEHATPFGVMPGPELHLNALNAALQGEFIRDVSHGVVALFALVAASLAVPLTLMVRSLWLRLLILCALDAVALWLTLVAFNRLSVYLPCLPFLAGLNGAVLLGMISDFALERFEKNRTRHTLERYVSTNVVRELLDAPEAFQLALGGILKPVAILFSDIRGFSSVTAGADPHTLVLQLNEYLSAMVECVFRHGGTLDKFMGDAVMAVWGNVTSQGVRDDTRNAVRAALEMRTELARLNRDWKKRGLPELRIGIAVNQGDVVVGNIGSPRRMEFTVIGEVVNLSWRLQELTKQLDSDLIVSQNVTALLVEDFELRSLGPVRIPGHAPAVEVYSVLGQIDSAAEAAMMREGRRAFPCR